MLTKLNGSYYKLFLGLYQKLYRKYDDSKANNTNPPTLYQ